MSAINPRMARIQTVCRQLALPRMSPAGDAEGGGRHESVHDKGEGASALFRWCDGGGDGRRGGGEHTRADCSKDAGTQCYAECWGEGGECVAEDEDDKARPERVAGRMSVLRMGAQQAKVMLKMVTSCAAVVVDTCRSEPISLRSPARMKVSVPTAKVMSVRGHSLFDILPTI